MNQKPIVIMLALVAMITHGSHAAESGVAQIEKCRSETGFSGSLYAVSPGDSGPGHHIRLRVRNGEGQYTRDNVYNVQQNAHLWHEWIPVRIMATKEGRLSIELKRPLALLVLDVSIDGRTITGSVEHLDQPEQRQGERIPKKIKITCADGTVPTTMR